MIFALACRRPCEAAGVGEDALGRRSCYCGAVLCRRLARFSPMVKPHFNSARLLGRELGFGDVPPQAGWG